MNSKEYKERLLAYLASDDQDDRLGWNGYMEAYNLFPQSSQGEQKAFIDAIIEIVSSSSDSNNKRMWLVAADLIHLAGSLELRDERLDQVVRELLAKQTPDEQCAEAISFASSTYFHLAQVTESRNLEQEDNYLQSE